MGGTDSGSLTAREYYLEEVHPSIVKTCGSCHTATAELAPGWMDVDPVASYELSKNYPGCITEDPANSAIIIKPAHEGPAFTDVQKGLFGKWINMELDEKGSTGSSMGSGMTTSSGKTVKQLFDEFANCMDLDLWKGAGMPLIPNQDTNDSGQCMSCHNQGAGGFFASNDVAETFAMNKTFPYIMRLVVPVYVGTEPTDLAPSLRIQQKGVEQCQAANQDICHPKYSLTPENVAAIEKFQSQTLQKWKSGACPMP
jgi:hypothetical protein